MDNLVIFSFIRKIIFALHWILYGVWIIPIIINAETWFFGVKYSGETAIVIHFGIGLTGMFLGYLIYKKYKLAYIGSACLFGILLFGMVLNHL